jgi:hypothetical protein
MVTTMRGDSDVLLVDMDIIRAFCAMQYDILVEYAGISPRKHPGGSAQSPVLFTDSSYELQSLMVACLLVAVYCDSLDCHCIRLAARAISFNAFVLHVYGLASRSKAKDLVDHALKAVWLVTMMLCLAVA